MRGFRVEVTVKILAEDEYGTPTTGVPWLHWYTFVPTTCARLLEARRAVLVGISRILKHTHRAVDELEESDWVSLREEVNRKILKLKP